MDAGDLLLFDSRYAHIICTTYDSYATYRLCHWNQSPKRGRERMATYVCYAPAAFLTEAARQRKVKHWEKAWNETHWAANAECAEDRPGHVSRTHGYPHQIKYDANGKMQIGADGNPEVNDDLERHRTSQQRVVEARKAKPPTALHLRLCGKLHYPHDAAHKAGNNALEKNVKAANPDYYAQMRSAFVKAVKLAADLNINPAFDRRAYIRLPA